MSMPIAECIQVTKHYAGMPAGVLALRGVDLAVESGEMLAVMGPSGCGKSTLLHMLGGLDTPTSGEVTVLDRRIDKLSETRRALLRRAEIGFVFQFFNLVADLSVADNVELPMLLLGASSADARERRDELLIALDVAEYAKSSPRELSGGQQQRVAIARALVNRPSLLLADEPTGNLDSASAGEVLALLREQTGEERSMVMVTHDPRVANVADRVALMEDGVVANILRPGRGEVIDFGILPPIEVGSS
jgi:putative ABC transport system ATP-binding protein